MNAKDLAIRRNDTAQNQNTQRTAGTNSRQQKSDFMAKPTLTQIMNTIPEIEWIVMPHNCVAFMATGNRIYIAVVDTKASA